MKRIGIVAWKVGENSFGVTIPYLEYLQRFGSPEFILPWQPIDETLDLVVLSGGPDVDPLRYGEFPGLYTSRSDPHKEYFDKVLLPLYIDAGVPIFGICRGMQSLAIHFGGRLHQNMYHETSHPDKRFEKVHNLQINERIAMKLGIISKTKNSKKYEVNSLHHQILDVKTIPDSLKVIATYPACPWGGIEAIAHRELPIAGVQYHPEELCIDSFSDNIIQYLLHNKKSLLTETETIIESEYIPEIQEENG